MQDKKILIIEDDFQLNSLIGKIARDVGFQTESCLSGKELVNIYEQFIPDIIVLDILMPDNDGFEVLKFLQEKQSRARIIILSGQDNYREMAVHMATGLGLKIDASVPKPFRVAALRSALRDMIADMEEVAGSQIVA